MQTFALQPSSGGCRLRKTGNFLSFLPHSPLILSREQQFPPSPSYPLPSYSATLERASLFSAFHTRPEWKDLLFSLSLSVSRDCSRISFPYSSFSRLLTHQKKEKLQNVSFCSFHRCGVSFSLLSLSPSKLVLSRSELRDMLIYKAVLDASRGILAFAQ